MSRRKVREPKEETVPLGPIIREGEHVFGMAHSVVLLENKLYQEKELVALHEEAHPWIPSNILPLVDVPASLIRHSTSSLALEHFFHFDPGIFLVNWFLSWQSGMLKRGQKVRKCIVFGYFIFWQSGMLKCKHVFHQACLDVSYSKIMQEKCIVFFDLGIVVVYMAHTSAIQASWLELWLSVATPDQNAFAGAGRHLTTDGLLNCKNTLVDYATILLAKPVMLLLNGII